MGFDGDGFLGMGLGQFGFMAEAEGQEDLVDTRDARLNAVCRELDGLAPGTDPMDVIDGLIEGRGIDIASLTAAERSRIDRHL